MTGTSPVKMRRPPKSGIYFYLNPDKKKITYSLLV
jgi:hypothetical protein